MADLLKDEGKNRTDTTDQTLPADETTKISADLADTVFSPDLDDIVADNFEILGKIGEGGMGVVYEVKYRNLAGRSLALKALLYSNVPDEVIKRFQREARILVNLNHPNIVKTHGFGVSKQGRAYLLMDLVPGHTLSSEIPRINDLAGHNKQSVINFTVEVGIQLCDALMHIHTRQHRNYASSARDLKPIVHRDLKPSNIMISWQNGDSTGIPHATILDFGIAKIYDEQQPALTETGVPCGTALYMSPEQSSGATLDQRSDIYSLGCILFECITRNPPYLGRTAFETIMMHRDHSIPIPTLSEGTLGYPVASELEDIVHKALEKDPAKRYQNAEELKTDLLAFKSGMQLNHAGVRSAQPVPYRNSYNVGSRTKYITVGITMFVVIAGAGIYLATKAVVEKASGDRSVKANVRKISTSIDKASDINVGETNSYTIEQLLNVPPNTSYDRYIHGLVQNDAPLPKSYEGQDLSDAGLGYILASEQPIKELNIARTKVTDAGLKLLARYTLKTLCLSDDNISDIGLQHLRDLRIRNLDLSGTAITDEGIRSLAKNRIIELDLSRTKLTNKGLEYVAQMPCLEKLNCSTDRVSDEGIRFLSRHNLVNVNLSGSVITDASLDYLTMPTLTTLNLTSTRVTDECLAKISKIESLAFLALGHDHISNRCIHFLRNNRNLTALDLRYNDISDDAVADLVANAVQLTELYLGGNKITDKAILFLNQFKSIEALDVSDTLISSNGLRRMATFDRLSYLDVSNVRASDANVPELITRLPNLSKIKLVNTQVSDRSMPWFAKSTHLAAIDLRNCPITKQGFRELCQSNTIREIILDQVLVSSLSREKVMPSKRVLRVSDQNLWTRPDF